MAKKQMKGDIGNKTGKSTRDAIKAKQKQGFSLEQIGKQVNRSASTIYQIAQGDIKNPPNGLADQIRKVKGEPKNKKMK